MRLWDPFAIRELSALLKDPVFRGRGVPPGDGRPVLLIPGFLAGDWALRMMHAWLGRVGYRAYLSGIVLNVQHSERMLSGLRRKVGAVQKETGSRVSLIGHSRGGLLAKVYSQRKPDGVEQVIALGAALVKHDAPGEPARLFSTKQVMAHEPQRFDVSGIAEPLEHIRDSFLGGRIDCPVPRHIEAV